MEDTKLSIRPAPSKHTMGRQSLTLSQHVVVIPSSSFVRRHPFTDEIMEVLLLPNWRNPIFEMFDGTINLDKHLDVYTMQLGLFTLEDAILCQVFQTSLKRTTLSWFTRLPPFFVDNFQTLTSVFGAQFTTF